MTLYEIGQQYLEALEGMEIDPETGEIIGGQAVAQLAGQFEEKCQAVGCYIKNLNALAEDIRQEKQQLAKRQKALETKAERLPCPYEGFVSLLLYTGSSDYDSAQMARLIDLVVQECKAQGIETMTPEQLARLKEGWHGIKHPAN